MKLRHAWLACALAVLQGCDGTPATAFSRHRSVSAPPPAVHSELSPAARSYLSGVLDLHALDSLLAGMPVAERRQFLAAFRDVERFANSPRGGAPETVDVVIPLSAAHPGGTELLERVWAPYWRTLPAAAWNDPAYPLPGRTPPPAKPFLSDSTVLLPRR